MPGCVGVLVDRTGPDDVKTGLVVLLGGDTVAEDSTAKETASLRSQYLRQIILMQLLNSSLCVLMYNYTIL